MVLTSKVGMTGTSGLLGKHVVQYFLKIGSFKTFFKDFLLSLSYKKKCSTP